MKPPENPLIVTNILGSDVPGLRLVRQKRAAEEVPTLAVLERKRRNGAVDLHIVIKNLNRTDTHYAQRALASLVEHFKFVPEADLYARLYPRAPRRTPKRRKFAPSRVR